MKRLNGFRCALLASAFVSSVAVAGTGLFVGGQAGFGEYQSADVAANVANSQKHLMGGLFAGYLFGNRHFNYGGAVEANAFGKKQWQIVNDTYTLKSSTVSLLAVGRYYPTLFDQNAYIQAMAGGAYVYQRTKTIGVAGDPLPIDTGGRTRKWKPELGFGLGYSFANRYNISVMYETIIGNKTAPFDTSGNVQSTKDFNRIATTNAITARFSVTFS